MMDKTERCSNTLFQTNAFSYLTQYTFTRVGTSVLANETTNTAE